MFKKVEKWNDFLSISYKSNMVDIKKYCRSLYAHVNQINHIPYPHK